ncbi:putative methyltransferase [uncultured Alphaproteobacteria bacterium]|uniref:Putative methyltransferase n=1 Tax=uncultured Alphaproteobacteria bacterium TaxID=91750 RepID=A0A212KIT5_9PROT|nr:putative methyltransferase [uncultured Alphaproteobacteria bacterium]
MDARPLVTEAEFSLSETPTEAEREAHASRQRWRLPVPRYLKEVYTWAYVAPYVKRIFDHQWVPAVILWFQDQPLMRSVLAEIKPGDRVYMPASVYGTFCIDMSNKAAPGPVTISDISTIQLYGLRKKRRAFNLKNLLIRRANAADPIKGPYDVAVSFLLLHEVPEDYKTMIVNNLLDQVDLGGKAIFVDYHKMKWWQPLWPVMAFVAWSLEPFTFALWKNEIADYVTPDRRAKFEWTKTTSFGGLYQRVVAVRKAL